MSEIRRYIVEEKFQSNGVGKHRRVSRIEKPFSEVQNRIWDEMCNCLTTDEPTRLAMLNAAMRVKAEALDRTLDSLGLELSPESREAIRAAMEARRREVINAQANPA